MYKTINNIPQRTVESTAILCMSKGKPDCGTLLNKMENICCIYKITNPKGLVYIGQSTNYTKRISAYRLGHCKGQIKLYNSIVKYGWEKHKVEIVQLTNESELNKLEAYYVDLFQSFNRVYGLNLRDGGGSHGKMSDESKEKMRLWKRKRTKEQNEKLSKSLTGTKRSDETKEKLRIINKARILNGGLADALKNAKKGNKKWTGSHHTKETKEYISKILTGRKRTSEHCANLSKAKKGKASRKARKVIDTSTGIIYLSVREASTILNIPISTFFAHVRGVYPSNIRFKWL